MNMDFSHHRNHYIHNRAESSFIGELVRHARIDTDDIALSRKFANVVLRTRIRDK
jgi:hypothetical protein